MARKIKKIKKKKKKPAFKIEVEDIRDTMQDTMFVLKLNLKKIA